MIQISVFYPQADGAKFDMTYYTDVHMPLVQRLTGDACRSVAVQKGLAGGAPGSPPPYIASGHLFFDSVQSFEQAFGPHAKEIMGDLPNFTNIEPTIQISEVVVG